MSDEIEANVGDIIYDNGFKLIIKKTAKMVTYKPLNQIVVSQIRDDSKSIDSQNEIGIETIKAAEPLDEDTQSGKTRTKLIKNIKMIKCDTITQKYDTYRGN